MGVPLSWWIFFLLAFIVESILNIDTLFWTCIMQSLWFSFFIMVMVQFI
jgi:hypothetical protein